MADDLGSIGGRTDQLCDEWGVKRLAPAGPTSGEWFLGSGLQSLDLDAIESGGGVMRRCDTLWTRYLRVFPPNFYWEIHNRITTVVVRGRSTKQQFVTEFLTAFGQDIGIDPARFVVVGDSHVVHPGAVGHLVEAAIPFQGPNAMTGRYTKVFATLRDNALPLLDIVGFGTGGDEFVEFHVNHGHVHAARLPADTVYGADWRRDLAEALGISTTREDLGKDLRRVRALAVADAIRVASSAGVAPGDTGAPHSMKALLKMFAIDALALKLPAAGLNFLTGPSREFFLRQTGWLRDLNPTDYRDMSTDVLWDRHGISEEHLATARGDMPAQPVPELPSPRYFTDVPLFSISTLSEAAALIIDVASRRA